VRAEGVTGCKWKSPSKQSLDGDIQQRTLDAQASRRMPGAYFVEALKPKLVVEVGE